MSNPYVGTNISGCNSPGLGTDKLTYSPVIDALAAALDAHDHSSNKGIQIDTAALANLSVTTGKIAAAAVDETKLATSVAGAGLTGGAGTALSVVVDNSGIEINTDTLRLKDAGVTTAKIADANVTLPKLAASISDFFVPVGAVLDFAGATAPTNYLLCYGQAVSRATYATLFAAIGESHGVGDGVTTFNLPDARGRTIAGKDNMGGSAASRLTSAVAGSTLGAAGGAQTHTLTTAELASHTHIQNAHAHPITDVQHTHGFSGTLAALQGEGFAGGGNTGNSNDLAATISAAFTGITTTNNFTAVNQSEGGGSAHNNVQPTLVLNKIIRAL